MASPSVLPESGFIDIMGHVVEIVVVPNLKCRGVSCDSRVQVAARRICINADVPAGELREVLDAAIVSFSAHCAPPAASLPFEEVGGA